MSGLRIFVHGVELALMSSVLKIPQRTQRVQRKKNASALSALSSVQINSFAVMSS
jgi:hypothetical protein